MHLHQPQPQLCPGQPPNACIVRRWAIIFTSIPWGREVGVVTLGMNIPIANGLLLAGWLAGWLGLDWDRGVNWYSVTPKLELPRYCGKT